MRVSQEAIDYIKEGLKEAEENQCLQFFAVDPDTLESMPMSVHCNTVRKVLAKGYTVQQIFSSTGDYEGAVEVLAAMWFKINGAYCFGVEGFEDKPLYNN